MRAAVAARLSRSHATRHQHSPIARVWASECKADHQALHAYSTHTAHQPAKPNRMGKRPSSASSGSAFTLITSESVKVV